MSSGKTAVTPVRCVPASEMRDRLQALVAEMERRHGRSSEAAIADVAEGRLEETAEIAEWLGEYAVLVSLQVPGPEVGSPSTAIKKSTTGAWMPSATRPSSKVTR